MADGILSIRVLPMGGNLVLLTFGSKEVMEPFFGDCSWLNQCAADIHPWQQVYTPTRRLIWLRLYH